MTKKELWEGIRDAFPIVLGYVPLGFAFGILASEAGMSVVQATAMSILCFTGAGQYIAIGVMKAGGAVATAVIANILVNMRYFLFATSLVPFFKDNVPGRWATLLSYGLTDETYAVAFNRYKKKPPTTSYMAGLNITSHIGWISSTFVGALSGSLIANTDKIGLGFALPAMYTCLLVLVISKRTELVVALVAAALCLGIGWVWPASMHNLFNIIIATVVAATIGVIINGKC
ncbi:4-azaleucine resistance probable transporter AzlC [Thermosyntropha lipolytica DSM 11003]|uniref:4-azaleucine resistance probable transporter AzlC n=1 Tax=Thermosyntropha lipolytica DSM 11003 TaxID=1123382 RepID=A0A1M5KU71_9FIRM|nr:AzlC family ABC transporter permease [Thermosyntropha lipolytica]SHG56069.1 4-azaleucine resistance probable transporter AzlC [Thermosyntropha lipolytica DSM 11003]